MRTAALALALTLAGCHWLLPFQPAEWRDRGSDTPSGPAEASGPLEWRGSDVQRDQAPLPSCYPPGVIPETIALYDFEPPNPLTNRVNAATHEGALTGSPTTSYQTVSAAQGQSLVLAGSTGGFDCNWQPVSTNHVMIPAHADWKIVNGAIRLKVRFSRAPTPLVPDGILGRDGQYANPGDLSLVRAGNGALVARLTVGGQQLFRCTPPNSTPLNSWLEVTIVFGRDHDLRLCLGTSQHADTSLIREFLPTIESSCTAGAIKGGIDGIDRPWAVGGTNWCHDLPVYPMAGAIDDLLIQRFR